MKCKDCKAVNCPYRVTGSEAECQYRSRVTKLPDEWQGVRIQAAIAAMQGTITILGSSDRYAFTEVVVEGFSGDKKTYPNEIAEFAVACADALINELKEK